MIRVNLFAESGAVVLPAAPRNKIAFPRVLPVAAGGVLIVCALLLSYWLFSGLPAEWAAYVPEPLTALMVQHSSATSSAAAQTSAPIPVSSARPVAHRANAVEEIVKTVRPDLFYNKERREYRELLPMERVNLQKAMLRSWFSMFRAITPPTFGFTDLVYKAPDYYFARGIGRDDKSIGVFLDSLRRRSAEFRSVPPAEGKQSLEFTAYGRLLLVETSGEKLQLVPFNQVSQELAALGDLAARQQVRLSGLDLVSVSDQGLYRRVLTRAQTRADFPAMAQFSEALLASGLRVGVVQVTMRPTENEGLVTVFDFVVYAAP